jgi:hypothetical protein
MNIIDLIDLVEEEEREFHVFIIHSLINSQLDLIKLEI